MSEAHALQSAGELPVDYRSALDAQSVLPAWTLLRALMPVGGAAPLALAHLWRYSQLRPLLLRAAELTPIEKAERRVLGYVNPGLHKDRLATLPSIFFGLQLIMPGERAPNHKHIPAAARIVIEGEGAYTSVNGEKLRMEAGDLVLTPPLHWHDHGHEGSAPVIWMDVLDHPLAVPLDISYVLPGEMAKSHNERPDSGDTWYSCPGLVPYQNAQSPAPYPLLRFKFSRVRETLRAIAEAAERSEKIHLRYCNPQTGESVLKTLEFSARLLRPGETIQLPRSSANHMFQMMEGEAQFDIGGAEFSARQNDSLSAPPYAGIVMTNPSSSRAAIILQVDDTPMQAKLGFLEMLAH